MQKTVIINNIVLTQKKIILTMKPKKKNKPASKWQVSPQHGGSK